MNEWLAQTLPRLRKVTAQFTVMSFGSGLFFLIKIGCLYLAEQFGLAAWLSYLVIALALTIVAWTYHSKVTFKSALSIDTAWRFSQATIGLMLVDYFGFIALTYVGHVYPVLSAIIMSGIQFGIRYLTYATYVFGEMERGPSASNVLLSVALLLGGFNYALAIDGTPPQKDGKENYCAGANLYLFNVVSQSCEKGEQTSNVAPPPTMKREPGTPLLVALTLVLTAGEGDIRTCVKTNSDGCRALRTHQRIILLLPFLALILLVYFAGCEVLESANLAGAAALCAAFGTGLIEGSMAFLTEPPAAVLLLILAWMLYRLARGRRLVVSSIVCGIALGLLSLTKALYFYFVPVMGLVALLALIGRAGHRIAAAALIAGLIAGLIGSLWVYRNHETFSSTAIAGRGDNVMSVRAAFTTMTWSQYWSGYLAFTPILGPKLIELLAVDPANVAIFNRSSPESFEKGPRRWEVLGGKQPGSRQQVITTVLEHWPMELALIPLTIYRSSFLPVGSNSHRGGYAALPTRSIRLLSLAVATVIAVAMMPAFLLNVVVDIWQRNVARLAFHLPAIYSVAVHSVTTHYIPRYNLPLFGVFAIELAMATFFLWTFLNSRGMSARRAVG